MHLVSAGGIEARQSNGGYWFEAGQLQVVGVGFLGEWNDNGRSWKLGWYSGLGWCVGWCR